MQGGYLQTCPDLPKELGQLFMGEGVSHLIDPTESPGRQGRGAVHLVIRELCQ